MASVLPISPSQFIIFTLLSSIVVIPVTGGNHGYVRTIDRKLIGLKKEKLSHFRFYWQDILTGPNPTSMRVVQPASNTSVTGFGLMNMIDNPLTEGPELSSKWIGKAQGFYSSAAQNEIGLLMVMNFAFMEGKYNGSTLTVLGRNEVFTKVREMPVIGGSGLFRFAKGYAQAQTNKANYKTGDATVEYNVYVLHY